LASGGFGGGVLWGGLRGGCRGGGAGWGGLVGVGLEGGDALTYESGGEDYYCCCNEKIDDPWLFHGAGLVRGLVKGSRNVMVFSALGRAF